MSGKARFHTRHETPRANSHTHQGVGSHLLDYIDLTRHSVSLLSERNTHVLGAGCHDDSAIADGADQVHRHGLVQSIAEIGTLHVGLTSTVQSAVEEVHGVTAQELGDEDVGRLLIHLARCAYLLEQSILEDGNAVRQSHSLGLIVGHVDRGGP